MSLGSCTPGKEMHIYLFVIFLDTSSSSAHSNSPLLLEKTLRVQHFIIYDFKLLTADR